MTNGYRTRQVFVENIPWQCQLMCQRFCCSLPSQLILPCCQIMKIKSKQIWLITRKIGLYCARLSNFWVSQSDRPYRVQFIEIRANIWLWKTLFTPFITLFKIYSFEIHLQNCDQIVFDRKIGKKLVFSPWWIWLSHWDWLGYDPVMARRKFCKGKTRKSRQMNETTHFFTP